MLVITCLSALLGCTSYTHERLLRAGEIDSVFIDSGYFQHRLLRATAPAQEGASHRLHIYLGGDGQPWRTPRQVARDPTSERSIMLKNMLKDDAESVFISRPCYYQVVDSRCQGRWWVGSPGTELEFAL